jgi:steroid 5-alpha reductase family enzyme
MNEPLPSVDVLRFATAFNYTLLGQFGMAVLAMCILAVSVVVLRTGVFGRWLGYVGCLCSTVMILSVLAQYGALTTPLAILWSLCLAVAIWRQPAGHAS